MAHARFEICNSPLSRWGKKLEALSKLPSLHQALS
jgi:hypothetical protein